MSDQATGIPALRMSRICKTFGPTRALDQVDLTLIQGEVHAVIGENGAGKSTLMNVLSGAVAADSGQIEFFGKPLAPANPMDSRRAGVAMIYQELALAPHLTVEENVLLGIEPGPGLLLDLSSSRKRAGEALKAVGLSADLLRKPVRELAIGAQQLVEVARAAASGFQVLILDEPTSSLTTVERKRLFRLIRSFKDEGRSVIYISHFLDEVLEIADRCTILRDGCRVETRAVAESSLDELAAAMVGRSLQKLYHRSAHSTGEAVLTVTRLQGRETLKRASFALYRGEVLGIAGLVGSGRTELLETIFGLSEVLGGDIQVADHSGPASPYQRWHQGVGYVSEDRKEEGLALSLSIQDNVTLPRLSGLGPCGLVLPERQSSACSHWMDRLRVKYRHTRQPVRELSGGNQQKVALTRLLYHGCDVLLLDEPTRGIDIGSKAEVYRLIDQLARGDRDRGVLPRAILFVSSYLPELLGVCDRIAVMSRGVLTEPAAVESLSEEKIMQLATTPVRGSGP